ncbi:hypothetical protein GCM10010435_83850 [Winogradskya consettensis]|uniref:Uncharacterized protein n=1 Tax=Winogradskya consettensis TaxID=113560 RepID=A0A919T1D8_9ACTN|nr:hypothetical protein [Actinoplanes consettensis]GIM82172.1 hypothetical protein Aco04nite_80250 [Actinoplanes consettensis]
MRAQVTFVGNATTVLELGSFTLLTDTSGAAAGNGCGSPPFPGGTVPVSSTGFFPMSWARS